MKNKMVYLPPREILEAHRRRVELIARQKSSFFSVDYESPTRSWRK